MIYFTSDTHFGHSNVIKYCGRPFSDVADMEDGLISRWNSVVSPRDTVYHLGDFAFCKPRTAVDIVNKLNGTIRLVPGNHDSRQLVGALYELPVTKVEVLERYVEFNYNSRKYVLCHFPIESWCNMTHGSIHLHGHSHGNSRKVPHRYDVGVDVPAWHYAPVSIETIEHVYESDPPDVFRPDYGDKSKNEM